MWMVAELVGRRAIAATVYRGAGSATLSSFAKNENLYAEGKEEMICLNST